MLNLHVDTRSATPIYTQIVEQVEGLIGRGALIAGDRVPSVRDLAIQLRVNRNTVARAYGLLESTGVLDTRIGQGSFVSAGASRWSSTESRRLLRDSVERLLAEARRLGVADSDVVQLVQEHIEASSPRQAKGRSGR